ncbi:dienelactone hydrolase family protein [Bacteroidia bacterium]|nr:dienelactone hydrolase family protein [Bacteroidia bacterium]
MKKVFYFTLFASMLSSACSTSSDKGALKDAAIGIEKGEAGTFTFDTKDGVTITADYYPNEDARKIILLLHQAGYSRGEYKSIAPRLVDSGFACLAVDLRSGGLVNEVFNETAKSAEEKSLPTSYIDAKQDIVTAIAYASANTDKEIILWGSSYSASLSLMVAAEDSLVAKVVAFSPGEYLSNQNMVKNAVTDLDKPVFITGSSAEFDIVVRPIVIALKNASTTEYRPKGPSDHGSKTLWQQSKESSLIYAKVCRFLKG